MNRLERQLLSGETGDAEPVLCLRSRTRIDTGGWLRSSPLWLCVAGGRVVTLAAKRRRYVASVAIEDLQAIYYSHSTGELVIEPGEDLMFNRIALSPSQALLVMRTLVGAIATEDVTG